MISFQIARRLIAGDWSDVCDWDRKSKKWRGGKEDRPHRIMYQSPVWRRFKLKGLVRYEAVTKIKDETGNLCDFEK